MPKVEIFGSGTEPFSSLWDLESTSLPIPNCREIVVSHWNPYLECISKLILLTSINSHLEHIVIFPIYPLESCPHRNDWKSIMSPACVRSVISHSGPRGGGHKWSSRDDKYQPGRTMHDSRMYCVWNQNQGEVSEAKATAHSEGQSDIGDDQTDKVSLILEETSHLCY